MNLRIPYRGMGVVYLDETKPIHESKNDILLRLKRVEGQVKGLQRMIEDEKCCSDILIQVAAVRAAMNRVGVLIFDEYAKTCFKDSFKDEVALKNFMEVLQRFIKDYHVDYQEGL